MDITKIRARVREYNRLLNKCQHGKSANVSTFQNQVLKDNPEGTIIWNKDNELRALALGILMADTDFPRMLLEAYTIRLKKNADYNRGQISLHEYFPFGLKSYVQEIHKKSLRLVSLAQDNVQPHNESVRDTLIDMINYCCFALETDDE